MADELVTPQALLRRLYHCELPAAARPATGAATRAATWAVMGLAASMHPTKQRFGPDGLNTYTEDTDTAPRTGSDAS